jgi:hypothetical protein
VAGPWHPSLRVRVFSLGGPARHCRGMQCSMHAVTHSGMRDPSRTLGVPMNKHYLDEFTEVLTGFEEHC